LKIDKRSLWNTDIPCPDEVANYLGQPKLFAKAKNALSSTEGRELAWVPPIFLYHETRGRQNYVDAQALYGGNGSPSIINALVESREILTYAPPKQEIDKLINDARRGEILSAFCKIEFCLDALICIEMGVYEGRMSPNSMQKELLGDRDGLFNTTHKKISYLRHREVIDDKTRKLLLKAKNIRNALAHQYLPTGDFGIEEKDVGRYETHLQAIDNIFNACWFHLLQAYSQRQMAVLNWLESLANQ
jgi:hypothetical protein